MIWWVGESEDFDAFFCLDLWVGFYRGGAEGMEMELYGMALKACTVMRAGCCQRDTMILVREPMCMTFPSGAN